MNKPTRRKWVAGGLVLLLAGLGAKGPADAYRHGRIEAKEVSESSGLVASRAQKGVFWTLNDSGNPAKLYAMTETGKPLGEFAVINAKNIDWEDLATDDAGNLYVADIGNNEKKRTVLQVYVVKEPRVDVEGKPDQAGTVEVSRTIELKYPEAPFDCEAFWVVGGKGYLIPKHRDFQPPGIYRFDLNTKSPATLEKIGGIPLRSPVTAADISPDGKRLVILTVTGPSVFDLRTGADLPDPSTIRSVPFLHPTMEAACFVEKGVLATTEARDVLLFRDEQFQGASKPQK